MSDNFFITNTLNGGLYVHFNPHSRVYTTSNKKLGACIFTKENGKKFIKDVLGNDWLLESLDNPSVIVGSKENEKTLYDKLH